MAIGAATALLSAGLAVLPTSAGASPTYTLVFSTVPTAATAGGDQLNGVTVSVYEGGSPVTSGYAGTSITIGTTSGSPILQGDSASINDGVATFANLAIDTAGTFTLTASDSGDDISATASNATVVSAGTATEIVFSVEPPSTTPYSATMSTFDVATADGYGNLTGTGSDTITLSSACTLSGTLTEEENDGVAAFSGISITSGTSPCKITATDSGSLGTALSSSITISTPTKVAFTSGPSTAAVEGVAVPTFKVSIEDTNGDVITSGTGSTDTVDITSTCAIGGTDSAAAVAGVATFSAVEFTTSGSPCTLTAEDATATTHATATSSSITVSADTPAAVAFTTQPQSTATAGTLLPTFAVSVEAGNGVVLTSGTGSTDSIVLTSTCKLAGGTSVAAVAGVATFEDVTIESTGTCQLVASDGTRSLATATSSAIVVAPGSATHLVFTTAPPATQESTTTALTTFKVSIEDVYDNVVNSGTESTDFIAITSTCSLSGTTTVAASAGVATFSAVTITSTGSCVLTATDISRTVATVTANVTVGAPQATLSVTSKSGVVGTALTLSTSGGSGTGAVTYTVTNGTATGCAVSGDTLTAKSIGTCLVTATKAASAGYQAATSASTTVTFVAPGPKAIRVVGTVTVGKTQTVTVVGSNFTGRPAVTSNVAGFIARVTHDSGSRLTVVITINRPNKPGVRVMTITLANGKKTSVRYSLR